MESSFKRVIIFLAILLIFLTDNALSLDKDTHKFLNETIAGQGWLDNYLRNNLGLKDGVKEAFKGIQVLRWIADGGKEEDEPLYLRSRNHFHNPLKSWNTAGLTDYGSLTSLGFTPMSSVLWAQDQSGASWIDFGGDWSWKKSREYFYQALTGSDKATREDNFANTFRSVGQIMHLVEDSSVPAHARNDTHIWGDGYEEWVRGNHGLLNLSPITFVTSIFNESANSHAPIPIAKIFDTDKYTGTNPSTSLSWGIAEYTNSNFASDDTIFTENFDPNHKHYFPYPRYSPDNYEMYEIDIPPNKKRIYLRKKGDGESIERFATAGPLYKYLSFDPALQRSELKLDSEVHSDYAKKLIPRAVGYSAGLLNYFFRGLLEESEVAPIKDTDGRINGLALRIKNNTKTGQIGEDIDGGHLLISYKYKTPSSPDYIYGLSNPINDVFIPFNNEPSDDRYKYTFAFSNPLPSDAADASYTIVYRGKLGNEQDAVVGKVIKGEGNYDIFWGSVDFSTGRRYGVFIRSENWVAQAVDIPADLYNSFFSPLAPDRIMAVSSLFVSWGDDKNSFAISYRDGRVSGNGVPDHDITVEVYRVNSYMPTNDTISVTKIKSFTLPFIRNFSGHILEYSPESPVSGSIETLAYGDSPACLGIYTGSWYSGVSFAWGFSGGCHKWTSSSLTQSGTHTVVRCAETDPQTGECLRWETLIYQEDYESVYTNLYSKKLFYITNLNLDSNLDIYWTGILSGSSLFLRETWFRYSGGWNKSDKHITVYINSPSNAGNPISLPENTNIWQSDFAFYMDIPRPGDIAAYGVYPLYATTEIAMIKSFFSLILDREGGNIYTLDKTTFGHTNGPYLDSGSSSVSPHTIRKVVSGKNEDISALNESILRKTVFVGTHGYPMGFKNMDMKIEDSFDIGQYPWWRAISADQSLVSFTLTRDENGVITTELGDPYELISAKKNIPGNTTWTEVRSRGDASTFINRYSFAVNNRGTLFKLFMNTEERMLVDYTAAGTQELSYTYKNDVKLFNGNSEQLLLSDNTQGIWVYDLAAVFNYNKFYYGNDVDAVFVYNGISYKVVNNSLTQLNHDISSYLVPDFSYQQNILGKTLVSANNSSTVTLFDILLEKELTGPTFYTGLPMSRLKYDIVIAEKYLK